MRTTPFRVGRRAAHRSITATLAAASLVLTTAGMAIADDISNRLDASVDAVAEVMPLTVGGANGTTQLYVTPQNGDGKNGCNLTGSSTLVVAVTSSDTGVATVSPGSVTFASCGDTPTLTVTPVAPGSTTISVSQTSNSTGGDFDLAPATFTVTVAGPTNTAPRVVVAGVAGGASYHKGDVPVGVCQVTDTEDGNSSFAASLSAVAGPYASDGIGSQTASCSYTDRGGLTATSSETYSIVDPSPPSIGYTLDPAAPDGSNGWYTGAVSLTWDVSDLDSPNSLTLTGCVDQEIVADQVETTYSCAASSAGGSAARVDVSLKRDGTAPVISSADVNDTTWRNTPLSQSFTASDATSGLVDATDAAFTLTAAVESADASTPTTDSRTVSDGAGNTATRTLAALIDLTAPSVVDEGPTTPPNEHGWYRTDVTNRFSASDALSGLAEGSTTPFLRTSSGEGTAVSVASGPVGDVAGNVAPGISSAAFRIDKTPPTVTCAGDLTYTLDEPSPAAVTASVTDALSQPVAASLSAAPDVSSVGTRSATLTGYDHAGNSTTVSCSYRVVYDWAGFFRPIDNLPTLNVAKAGSAIPVKFSLDGNQGTAIFAPGFPKSQVTPCEGSAPQDGIEETVTAGASGLQYDPTTDTYTYVWKTDKAWAGTCRQLVLQLADGSYHRANFKLAK